MPQGRFNEYSPQEQAALARDMLQKAGRPITANNLNAAMLALMRNEELPSNNIDAAIERTMQPRRQQAPQVRVGTAQGGEGSLESSQPPANDELERVHNATEEVTEPASVYQTRGAQVAAGQPTARRAGTINAATRIDEANPEAGMFEGTQPRQANETGVDQVGLGLTMLSPLLAALGLPALAARGGSAVGPVRGGAEYVGRAPFQATPGRVVDVPPSAIAGQSQRMLTGPRGELSAPTAPATQAATPPASAPAQVGSARQGQAELPRPDADLRRRMIERNTERSYRNAQRTRDERAAGNTDKGRRERIERVPEGEVSPPRKPGVIRLPPSRRRVSETAGNRRDTMRDEQ